MAVRRYIPRAYFVARQVFDKETYIELYRVNTEYTFFFRDRLTGRFVPRKDIYRLVVCVRGIVVHRTYYAAIAVAFGSKEVLEANKEDIKSELERFIEKEVRYPRHLWWFASALDEEQVTDRGLYARYVVEFEVTLYEPFVLTYRELFEHINLCTLRYEDEEGVTISEEHYFLRVE